MLHLPYTSYYTLMSPNRAVLTALEHQDIYTVCQWMLHHKRAEYSKTRNAEIASMANRVLVRKLFEGDFNNRCPPPAILRRQTHQNCAPCGAICTEYDQSECWNCGYFSE